MIYLILGVYAMLYLVYAPLALHCDIMHHMCILYIYLLVMHT